MEVVAYAIDMGWRDPLALLDVDDDDWMVALAVMDAQLRRRRGTR